MSLSRKVLLLAAALGLAACASASGGRSSGSRDVLTSEELRAETGRTLEDVIRQFRPQWLVKRGATSMQQEGEIVVYQDNTRMGGPEFLRTIQVHNVESVRFLGPGDATTRFGTGHTHGAIVVTLRRR